MQTTTTNEKSEPKVRSSAVLGSTVESGEMWAILTDDGVQDLCPSAETAVAWLAGRIGKDDAGTRRFMDQVGWLLVRVQTSHKIVAVLKTLNEKVLPNNQLSDGPAEP